MNSEERKIELWPWDFDEYPIWFGVQYDSGPSGFVPYEPLRDPGAWTHGVDSILVRCTLTFADGTRRLAEAEIDGVDDIWFVHRLHVRDDDGELAVSIDLRKTAQRDRYDLARSTLRLEQLLDKEEKEIFPLRVEVIGRRLDYMAIPAAREILSIDQVIPSLQNPGIP